MAGDPRPLTLCERLLADIAASRARSEASAPAARPPHSHGPTAALYAALEEA